MRAQFILATLICCGISTAASAQTTPSQGTEGSIRPMDQKTYDALAKKFPLEKAFNQQDKSVAEALAFKAAPVFDETLVDYKGSRFKNVWAQYHQDIRSFNRSYYICGLINTRNRMGGYTGWQKFAVEENGSLDNTMDAANKQPTIFLENQFAAGITISMDCEQGREARYVADADAAYAKYLMPK